MYGLQNQADTLLPFISASVSCLLINFYGAVLSNFIDWTLKTTLLMFTGWLHHDQGQCVTFTRSFAKFR